MRTTARSLEALVPISCPCWVLPLESTTVILCAPLTTWLLVTMSPCASIITPEPICSPCAVVTSSSTTDGSTLAMAASCWACSDVVLEDVAVEVVPAVVVVLACANSHPENRPVPKMRARMNAKSTMAPAGPGRRRLLGRMGGKEGGPAGEPGDSTMSCSLGVSVMGGGSKTPTDADDTG